MPRDDAERGHVGHAGIVARGSVNAWKRVQSLQRGGITVLGRTTNPCSLPALRLLAQQLAALTLAAKPYQVRD